MSTEGTTKHYVEFCYPGLLFSDSSTQEIKSRDAKFKVPKNSHAYRFFDRVETEVGGEKLVGQPKNHSKFYYVGGVIKSQEDIRREKPGSILLSNMEINRYKNVIMTRFGQALPFENGDCIVAVED